MWTSRKHRFVPSLDVFCLVSFSLFLRSGATLLNVKWPHGRSNLQLGSQDLIPLPCAACLLPACVTPPSRRHVTTVVHRNYLFIYFSLIQGVKGLVGASQPASHHMVFCLLMEMHNNTHAHKPTQSRRVSFRMTQLVVIGYDVMLQKLPPPPANR